MEQNELKQAFASLAGDKSRRTELAQLLVEYIQPQHLTMDIMSLFLNTRQLKLGDALVKKVRRGIEVRKLVPGSVHLSSEVTVSDRINYTLEGADVKVNYNLWEMEAGDIGSVGDMKSEMMAKLTDYYVNRAFSALSTIWSAANTPNNFTNVGGTLTATALKNAIDNINTNVGKVKAVVGSRKALTPITTFGAGFDVTTAAGTTQQANYPALDEIYRTGWLGQYYGAPIVALNQFQNNAVDYTNMIPEDKVLVIGENAGEFILYGPTKDKAWEDMEPTPPMFYLETWQQFGMIIDNAMGIHVLKVA
jgi:hypothetical protein